MVNRKTKNKALTLKRIILVAVLAMTLLAIVPSCEHSVSDAKNAYTTNQFLVFDDRDVRQARNHAEAGTGFSDGSKEQQVHAMTMMSSMATGIVYTMQPEPRFDPTSGTCTLANSPVVGSGFLTSSTRLATAHHVVWPIEEPTFLVRFAGSGDSSDPMVPGGRFISDDSAFSYDHPFPVYNNSVENFFFGNRLVQLGLDDWSSQRAGEPAVDIRRRRV